MVLQEDKHLPHNRKRNAEAIDPHRPPRGSLGKVSVRKKNGDGREKLPVCLHHPPSRPGVAHNFILSDRGETSWTTIFYCEASSFGMLETVTERRARRASKDGT
ncbi:hypothetical protein KM043_014510 [Ampulex compressa]|nr:hypothetical protein KM043_014510 [Ampulex compressa]